ncbi:MAG: hypothetical protein ACKOKF_04335 [Bacteroidota bacterium]
MKTVNSNVLISVSTNLIFIVILSFVISADGGTGGAGGSGGKRLDIFSGQKPANSPTDTLSFELASSNPSARSGETIPDRFRLYDLDLDGDITGWETNEVVKDFKENDSPYSEREVYQFIDYFFSASDSTSRPGTY